MSTLVDVELLVISPAGLPGVLRLRHECSKGKTALLSMECRDMLGVPIGSAPLTTADMHQLVDGLMDAIQANERQERL
ncbi:MAG: hypothetical protein E2591_24130 [Achromobacter sp.]|jgi:hypothetical protein|uniref:hypothetical protein n=1 Tax=Achromobacter TaxID=222 RepID=UPI000F8FA7E4|nr:MULTISPECIES: hypothetical protein [Achromobacter]AZS77407.1 hypothetical protein ELS24_02490 [Achromobacter spanius]MPS81168.1 hypothetical protein [Achromobacter sp.]